MDADTPTPWAPHPLLSVPTEAQAHLLDVVWHIYSTSGRWPIYQYVEAVLYQQRGGLDAQAVLLGCPWLIYPHGLSEYGWLWLADENLANARIGTAQPGYTVGLTVMGMSRVPQAEGHLGLFLGALRVLVGRERSFQPSPTTVQTVEVTAAEVQARMIPPNSGWVYPLEPPDRVGDILRHEPSTRRYVLQPFGSATWTAQLSSFIRAYDGVQNVEDYVERLTAEISPPGLEPHPVLESSLALPEAIDYLNAVWRRRTPEPLFHVRRAAAASKLAFECNSADEFDSRVSALCSILDHAKIPGTDGRSQLYPLQTYLAGQLPPDGVPRTTAAMTDLRALFDLRAWQQHSGGDSEKKGLRAMERLGVRLPAADWGAAWRRVQFVTVAALNTLREEVERVEALAPVEQLVSDSATSEAPGDPAG